VILHVPTRVALYIFSVFDDDRFTRCFRILIAVLVRFIFSLWNCISKKIVLLLQVNLVLEDAVEFSPDPNDKTKVIKTELQSEILLNGNQIAILVPGGTGPPDDSLAAASGG
jgi:hypothetical protein